MSTERARGFDRNRRAAIRRRISQAVGTCAALVVLSLSACTAPQSDETSATTSFTAMDTAMAITVYAHDQSEASENLARCNEIVRELDKALSPTEDGSWIARLNAAEGEPLDAPSDVRELVVQAQETAEATDGAFDPTVYPLTSAWGFTNGAHRTPSDAEIEAALARVSFHAVHVDAASGAISLEEGAQLDVGGIAKGFAADRIADELRERNVSGALIDLGGNVTVLGAKPDNTPWTVGIADPLDPASLAGTLRLAEATISTSGDYQRFFIDDEGIRRHHLIDPKTGYPAESGLSSVSVVARSGARADALSTALFVLGADRAVDLWRATQGDEASAFEAVLITRNGAVLVTEGLSDFFTPEAAYEGSVETVRR